MKIFPKGTTIDTTNLQPGELIHMEFSFYNMTSIQGFTSMITVMFAQTIMIWVFLNATKRSPVIKIRFIVTKLKNKKHTCRHVRVDVDGNLEKSTDVTKLLVYDLIIAMETAGGDASWINRKNE